MVIPYALEDIIEVEENDLLEKKQDTLLVPGSTSAQSLLSVSLCHCPFAICPVQRNVETSEDQQLDGSTLDTASSLSANFQNDTDVDHVPGDQMPVICRAWFNSTEHKDDKQGEDGAQEKQQGSELNSKKEQRSNIINSLASDISGNQ